MTITPYFVTKLSFLVQPIVVGTHRIDGSPLLIYDIVITGLLLYDR